MKEGNCENCGVFRKWLHRHHVKPKIEGGTDADGEKYICANCHEDEHDGPFGGVHRGRTANSPSARRKRSKTLRRLWTEPEYRKKTIAGQKRSVRKRDYKAIGEKVSASWTPERRAAHSKLLSKIKGQTLDGRWALKHDRCKGCRRTDRPHFGKGFCSPCYHSRYFKKRRTKARRRKYLREYMRQRRSSKK